jgi:hypothetical protein
MRVRNAVIAILLLIALQTENHAIDVFSGVYSGSTPIAVNATSTYAVSGVWFINNGQYSLGDSTMFHLVFDDIIFDDGSGDFSLTAGDLGGEVEPAFLSKPLVYPNPVRFSQGNSQLGYVLNTSVAMRLVIYDIFGHQIYDKSFTKGSNGAAEGKENRIPITEAEMGAKLSSGVYFYLLLTDETNILGRGKFAVVP